jgi:E3 ubiquitin-protein ligase MARCH6
MFLYFIRENLIADIFNGCIVVMCTLCFFISLVWLREHIMHGGGPDWLDVQQEVSKTHLYLTFNLIIWFIKQENIEVVHEDILNEEDDNRNQIIVEEDEAEIAEPLPDAGANDNNNNNEGAQNVEGAVANVNANNDDVNWNPIEWDRAAEELTWERLLGLDGSLIFIEHVFWVVSLNTLFVLVFGNSLILILYFLNY